MADRNGFTPVQERMLSVLADGHRHTREELFACLWDDRGALSNIQVHISRMREILKPRNQTIVCELYQRKIWYRYINLVQSKPAVTTKTSS